MVLRCIAMASFSLLFAAAPVPVGPAGTVKVVAIVKGLQQEPKAQDIQLFRSKSRSPELLTLGVELEPGDRFRSLSGKTVVQIRCADGTVMSFQERFDVLLILEPKRASCAVDLGEGNLSVLADKPTEVNAAGIPLASTGTTYSVDVQARSGEKPDVRVAVFEGSVELNGESPREIPQSKALTISQLDAPAAKLGAVDRGKDILPMARMLAQVDVARAQEPPGKLENPEAAFRQLEDLHTRVLISPDDREARLELARLQTSLNLKDSAIFHLRRTGLSEPEIQKFPQESRPPAPPDTGEDTADSRDIPVRLYVTMILAGSVQEVSQDFQRRIDEGTVTSQHYCAMATAVATLFKRDPPEQRNEFMREKIEEYAPRALRLHAGDGLLDSNELARCTRFANGEFDFEF